MTALLFLEAPQAGGELIFPWAMAMRNVSMGASTGASRSDSCEAGADSDKCRCSSGAPGGCLASPEGVHGTGRSHADYFALRELPRLDEVGMCHEPTDALRIEPRVGRLVIFFNHDHEGRMLKPATLHGSCPVRHGRKRIAQRWYQWHALGEPNALGTLLERVHGPTAWRVDYRSSATACADSGPWPCTEEGCPSPSIDCAMLAKLEACGSAFTDIWAVPPAGTERRAISDLCPQACGKCAS